MKLGTRDDHHQDQRHAVLREIDQLGIRYPGQPGDPPKDEADAIEQERLAIEQRLGSLLNRLPGEMRGPPTLTVINGGRDATEDPKETPSA